ncbi:MAG: hypothetical protein JWR53_49, partial [Glaciihabitans sp.]|nr:hypothetical protein [Glaciihabitans sp.]
MATDNLPEFTVEELVAAGPVELEHFTYDDAVELGLIAVDVIKSSGHSLAVDIVIGDDLVFRAKLRNTNKGNDPWLAGKAAVARKFREPSLLVKLRHLADGAPFEERDDIDHETHKAHGGSIPLFVGGELVATITMSGEPD